MPFLDNYMDETSVSQVPDEAKRLCAYLTVGFIAQAQLRTFEFETSSGHTAVLPHTKFLSLSCILTGKPGSHKSECVRLCRAIVEAHKELNVYPHDQVSREYLITYLVELQKEKFKSLATKDSEGKLHLPLKPPPLACAIFIEELVNFLNRRDYVEPLVGALNTLLDQPPTYGAGTQRRGGELLYKPIVSLFAACAPSWFTQLPETLFTGGFAGRCLFYYVPYPKEEDRQPRGQIAKEGAPERLARSLKDLPPGPLRLSPEALRLHDQWHKIWTAEDASPLQVLDEWLKRRTVQVTRLAGTIALANDELRVQTDHMEEANDILEEVGSTLERIWYEVESEPAVQWMALRSHIGDTKCTIAELETLAVRHLKSVSSAHRTIKWWQENGILIFHPDTNRWSLAKEAQATVK